MDVRIVCLIMVIWGEDFYVVGKMFDMKVVWEGMVIYLCVELIV